jgi:hypothetical protein
MRPSSSASRAALVAATFGTLGLCALSASGCSAACDPSAEANTPEVFSGGVTQEGGYETGPWFGPHLPFPGGKRWKLEHHLGFAPRNVSVYLAFGGDNTELAPCAGNTCVFCVDAQYVWLRNDTCSEFWVRATADGRTASNSVQLCEGSLLLDAAASADAASTDASFGAEAASADAAIADGTATDAPFSADAESTDATSDVEAAASDAASSSDAVSTDASD